MKKNNTSKKDYYKKSYVGLFRFISYYYQIDSVKKRDISTILEVGIGNKTVSSILKNQGYKVTTCDFDKTLNPDFVMDVRNLSNISKKFDAVLAFQILEHIPLEDLDKALFELFKVSKKYVIISLPYSALSFNLVLRVRMPFFSKIFNFLFKIPYFFHKVKINKRHKQHFWELGRKGNSLKLIKNKIKKYYYIEKSFFPILNSYHYFMILRKKDFKKFVENEIKKT